MQPKTEVRFDEASFERVKRTIRNMSVGRRRLKDDPGFALEIPDEVGLQLTNRCNLRCKHCFQWNQDGFFNLLDRDSQRQDLDFAVVEKILRETAAARSNLYLWGGEPLSYSAWPELAAALERDPRWTVLCTNGIAVEDHLDALLPISANLAVLVSVEGFEREHDAVRGRGTYRKVMRSIDLLLDLKRRGVFRGELSVNCVLSAGMTGKLFEFAELLEDKGINTLYLCFPWYIPPASAVRMDQVFREQFAWLRPLPADRPASWHSYSHRLDPGLLDDLRRDLRRIAEKTWRIRLRFQPALAPEEIPGFVLGEEHAAQGKTTCVGLATRMNVMPDGSVTACKLFPEFVVGNLHTSSVAEVWSGDAYARVRRSMGRGLMPVCSKCILLYLHGA